MTCWFRAARAARTPTAVGATAMGVTGDARRVRVSKRCSPKQACDGLWRDGLWRDGLWRDGLWRDALWRDALCR